MLWNKIGRKCLFKPNIALLNMTFYFQKHYNLSWKSKKVQVTLCNPPTPLECHVLFEWLLNPQSVRKVLDNNSQPRCPGPLKSCRGVTIFISISKQWCRKPQMLLNTGPKRNLKLSIALQSTSILRGFRILDFFCGPLQGRNKAVAREAVA